MMSTRGVHSREVQRLSDRWTKQLAMVLASENQIRYTLVDRIRTAQLFVFRIVLDEAPHLNKVLKMDDQIGMRLGVQTPRLTRNDRTIDIELVLPKDFQRVLSVGALPQQPNTTWVTVGQTPIGAPVRINLAGNNTAHTLIAGRTGSGKTVVEQLISYILATNTKPQDVGLILIDGKGGTEWWGFKNVQHLCHPIIGNAAEAVNALAWAVKEMDQRRHQGYSEPSIFVVIDELRDLIELAGDAVPKALSRLVSVGRQWGIHVIAATQHPLTDAIGGSIANANFSMRLVGQVVNARNAYLASGVSGTGAEKLHGEGDFLAVVNGRPLRLQMGFVGLMGSPAGMDVNTTGMIIKKTSL